MSIEGEWVGGDSFRVDHATALRRMARYQLADPHAFPEWWVRAGVALGAREIVLQAEGPRFAVLCKGVRLRQDELATVWDPLIDEAGDARTSARRWLAIGLLAARRLKPRLLHVESGAGHGSMRMDVLEERGSPLSASLDGLLIEIVSSTRWLRADASHALARLWNACRSSPVPIRSIEGDVPRAEDEEGWWRFALPRLTGWLRASNEPRTRLELGVAGVRVSDASFVHPIVQVDGVLDCGDVGLTLSGSAVIRDERLDKALRDVVAAMDQLVVREAKRLPRELGKLRGDPRRDSPAESRLRARLEWLRSACRVLRDPERDASRPALRALWDARVHRTGLLRRVSLREVEEVRRRTGLLYWGEEARRVRSVAELAESLRELGDGLSDARY
ncbi:MAG: hypothetical protein HY553_21705 [Elusimicrobia bacterium]|nr:hypothetical protein [Elusimicrobiota bacterium]